jgi:transposase-like protein
VVVSFAGHRMHLWGAVDSEGEVFDFLVQASRDKAAALKLLRSRGRLRRRWTSEATSMQTPWHLRPMSTPNALSQYPESGITGAGHATSRQVRRISLLQDFMRDWRRWSKTERATALCLAATLMSGIPALFFAMHLG